MEFSVESLETPALTKAQLAELLFEQIGLNKRESKDMIDAFFDLVAASLVDGAGELLTATAEGYVKRSLPKLQAGSLETSFHPILPGVGWAQVALPAGPSSQDSDPHTTESPHTQGGGSTSATAGQRELHRDVSGLLHVCAPSAYAEQRVGLGV